jgi:hypothetical protein
MQAMFISKQQHNPIPFIPDAIMDLGFSLKSDLKDFFQFSDFSIFTNLIGVYLDPIRNYMLEPIGVG